MRQRLVRHAIARWAWLCLLGWLELGCLVTTSTTVRVRDSKDVTFSASESAGGRALLTAGKDASPVPMDSGTYWEGFSRKPFEVRAARSADGTLELLCDGCPVRRHVLIQSDGQLAPSVERGVPTAEGLRLPYKSCLIPGHRTCQHSTRALVDIPWENILEAHYVERPIRWAGAWVAGMGALQVALGAWLLTRPSIESNRVLIWLPISWMSLSAAIFSWGLWHVLAPVRDEDLTALRPRG